MRDTRQFRVDLPDDMAEAVEKKISSGAYASVSDMIQESVRALLERDNAVERWLSDEVVKSYDQYKADPVAAIPANQVLARIQARRASGGRPKVKLESCRLRGTRRAAIGGASLVD